MKQEGVKFLWVRTIEHIRFPKLDPTRNIRLDYVEMHNSCIYADVT